MKKKTRKWVLYFHRLGNDHLNFADEFPSGDAGGVEAFMAKESCGETIGTDSEVARALTAGKKIHGLMVDMIAEDWAKCLTNKEEVLEFCNGVPNLYEEIYKTK